MKNNKIILKGILQKADRANYGRIYPREVFEKEMSELLNSGGKVSATRGCVTALGGDLYAKFGSTDDELLKSFEAFIDYQDYRISLQAVQRIIEIRTNKLIRKQL